MKQLGRDRPGNGNSKETKESSVSGFKNKNSIKRGRKETHSKSGVGAISHFKTFWSLKNDFLW